MPLISDVRGRAARTVARAPLGWVAALATAGIVAGHTLTYWAVVREADHRDALLQATGHAYWGAAVNVACLCAAWAVGAQVVRNVRAARRPSAITARSSRFATRLVTLQVAGFVAMEITERLASGEHLSPRLFFDHGTLMLGVIVQIAVGVLLARAVEWLGRTTRWLAEQFARVRRTHPRSRITWVERHTAIPVDVRRSANGIRGPPVVSSSFVLN